MDSNGNGAGLQRTPAQESEIARRRQRQTIRISRIVNGYLITNGESGESSAARDRRDMHAQVDAFFDRLDEAESTVETHSLPKFQKLAAAS